MAGRGAGMPCIEQLRELRFAPEERRPLRLGRDSPSPRFPAWRLCELAQLPQLRGRLHTEFRLEALGELLPALGGAPPVARQDPASHHRPRRPLRQWVERERPFGEHRRGVGGALRQQGLCLLRQRFHTLGPQVPPLGVEPVLQVGGALHRESLGELPHRKTGSLRPPLGCEGRLELLDVEA